ncbi:thermonuclease family protein [Methanosphaera sp.]
MKLKFHNLMTIILVLALCVGLLSTVNASYYQGTGFTNDVSDNYYDSMSTQDILNKYNDTTCSKEITSTCVKVVDGDTIYLASGDKIRLVGVNTPERGQQGYKSAKNFVKKLCLNKEVSIDVDDSKGKDKYNRTLGVVIVGNKNLNEMLLKENLAEVMYIPPSEFRPYTWT